MTSAHLHAPAPLRTRVRIVPRERTTPALVVLAIILILVLLGPYINYKPAPFTGEGNPMRQLIFFSCALTLAWAARPLSKPDRLLAIPLIMMIALGWCWVSLAWSAVPDISVRRLLLTTIVMWTIFMIARQAGYRRSLAIMRLILVGILIANYVASVGFPQFGVHQAADLADPGIVGSWRGVMLQKNFAGATCALTILLFVFDSKPLRPWLCAIVIAATAYYLYRTNSKTSGGILIFSMLCGYIYARYNPAYRALLIPLLSVIGVGLFLASEFYWDALAAPFSSKDAFTGRVQIWPVLIEYAQDHWMLGSGYGAFWNIGGTTPIYNYASGWLTEITSGHNGYLDLLIQIGFPGMLIVVFAALIWPLVKLLSSRTIPRQTGALLVTLLLFCAGHNLTESSLFDRDQILQVFLIITLAFIWRETNAATSETLAEAANGR
ncbi:O-antigen ligase [Sphingosinicella sp. BN140058]|uniref:O-antigen ligase family protein n=1 Tax=Sphingosinicella sp. BN140058 TaxID=1892855 RepID=UPI00101072D0|nr:O-antigen ligase family protein [Sphingosinicella sp. BN140058]QAY77485.1 O-antigen ligase family protein [Sphingosinicella sp. BN140058]